MTVESALTPDYMHTVALRSFQLAVEPPADEYEMQERMSYPNQSLPVLINKILML